MLLGKKIIIIIIIIIINNRIMANWEFFVWKAKGCQFIAVCFPQNLNPCSVCIVFLVKEIMSPC